MKNKRGMSAVITTLIIILLTIVALGIVWVVVKNVISNSSKQINLRGLGKGLEIKKALVSGNDLSVTVYRNSGEGNITAIKFVIGDGDNSVVIKKQADIPELGTRTFAFDLSSGNLSTLGNITSISVAPIYTLSTGEKSEADVMDTVTVGEGGIATGTGGTGGGENPPPEEPGCTPQCSGLDCGDDGCEGSCGTCDAGFYCADNQSCVDDSCVADNDSTTCSNQNITCGLTTDNCGQSVDCSSVYGNCSVQYNESWVCSDGTCVYSPVCTDNCTTLGYECGVHEICGEQVDCEVQTGGCDPGYECVAGNDTCQRETPVEIGTIFSTWPTDVNYYFDSPNLTKDPNAPYVDSIDSSNSYYVRLITNAPGDCIQIFDFVTPNDPDVYNMSYIRLATSQYVNISAGDSYQVWKDQAGCVGA